MVSKQKVALVENLRRLIEQYPVIGLLDMENLPARQLRKMKALLRGKGVIMTMARKRLLRRALESAKKENIILLAEKLTGMPALLFTQENPFSLYALLQKNKSAASARPGQKSPRDIVVPAGPTNFAPGPIISELAAVGIKTGVEGGKLVVKSDATLVKEGESISSKVAEVLKRLDIHPMEIGLTLHAVWENGLVFAAKQLRIDEEEYRELLTDAIRSAFNMAVDVAYPTDETIELLLAKAYRESRAVAIEGKFISDDTAEDVVMAIEREALVLSEEANVDALVEQVRNNPEAFAAPEEPPQRAAREPAAEPPIPVPATDTAMEVKQAVDQFAQVPKPSQEQQDIKNVEDFYQKLHQEKMQKMKLGSKKGSPPASGVTDTEQLFQLLKKQGTLRK